MLDLLSRLRRDVSDRFLAALAVALSFVVFLTYDQQYWWRLKPDYVFGWLAPLFALYIVVDRWPRLREVFRATGSSPLPPWLRTFFSAAAGFALVGGLAFFLMGAGYRAAAGVTQPGSLALAIGFSGILLGMVYFNTPKGCMRTTATQAGGGGPTGPGRLGESFRADARLRASALFLFPALIWVLSAPLVTAVENAVSLFLLRKVVADGNVGVADACSGIRSLTGCLFAGSFLAAVFLDRFWKKILLVAAAMGFAFLTNLMRSLFLTAWAYAYGSDAIEGRLHDGTGFAVLGLTCVGLFALLPLFSSVNWCRWLGLTPEPGRSDGGGP
jgi:exosortase/archaeosortase family protein